MGVSRNRWLCLCHSHVLEEWHLSSEECKLYGLASVAGPLGSIGPRALLEVAVSCEHCLTSISIYGEGWEGYVWILHLRALEESRRVDGVFSEAEKKVTLWDKNKLAGDVCDPNSKEGRGHWERERESDVGNGVRSAGICLPPLEGWHVSQTHGKLVLESLFCMGIILYKETEGTIFFKGCIIRTLCPIRPQKNWKERNWGRSSYRG